MPLRQTQGHSLRQVMTTNKWLKSVKQRSGILQIIFMEILIISKKISLTELKKIAKKGFGDLVKGVVDIDKEIMAIGGELHADEEAALLEQGSKQDNLWGINLYPNEKENNFIEFDSVINFKPRLGNRSRGVEDEKIRKKILDIIKKLIEFEWHG